MLASVNGHSGPGSLTAADLEILRLAATGMLNAEIAEHLGSSRANVQEGLERVIVALGARSKLEAVLIALRLGLIDLPRP